MDAEDTDRREAFLTQRHIPLSQDAALVVALAGTAMPFAHSAEDEAERWLRALRLHGHVGASLQALGVGESPLMTGSEAEVDGPGTPPMGPDVLDDVTKRASDLAAAREAETVGTADILFAVLDVYGKLFDRVLYLRGTSREELAERLVGAGAARGQG
ncbi:MAG: hypothetical protein ABWY65_09715 [Thermoleophilaceae bacterium]|jgi:hypothetical protein